MEYAPAHHSLHNPCRAAISSIGSGIGQSVIHSLRLSCLPTQILGFGNGSFEYGALECDWHENVPAIHDPEYVDALLDLCLKYQIGILIPGLDGDLQVLSRYSDRFQSQGTTLLSSSADLIALCRDKKRLADELSQTSEAFVQTFNRDGFGQALGEGRIRLPCVAKPRDGSGSLGVRFVYAPAEADDLPEGMVFQNLAAPAENDPYYREFQHGLDEGRVVQVSELSVQVVLGRSGEFLGRLATLNRLKGGVPIEIFPVDLPEIWETVDPIVAVLKGKGLRGPVNIQGRFTEQGIRFFEINPRFTGITGMRAMLGFNEVEACLKSWLDLPQDSGPIQDMPTKFGIRQVADRTVAIARHPQAREYYQAINRSPGRQKQTLLMTGSTGYLGRAILDRIDFEEYQILILTRDKRRAKDLLGSQAITIYDHKDLSAGVISWGSVDLLLHCGFARPFRQTEEIANSLAFTSLLYKIAELHESPAIVNISTQSVYGQDQQLPWMESTPPAPSSPYGMAKYASELMLSSLLARRPYLSGTSLRLAGLTGGSPGLVPVDLVTRFVQQALRGETLQIWGEHHFERLDVRDAAAGVAALLNTAPENWEEVYNLGQGETFSIRELARLTVEEVSRYQNSPPVQITVDLKDPPLRFGMDSQAFHQLTGWRPQFNLQDSIQSLISYLQEPSSEVPGLQS